MTAYDFSTSLRPKEVADMFTKLSNLCHQIADGKGFHQDHELVEAGLALLVQEEQLNLEVLDWFKSTAIQAEIGRMHSELSECLEAVRHDSPPDDHLPQFDQATVELADCIIRICDTAGKYNMPLGEALVAKLEYNVNRPHKHGKNS